MQEASNGQMTSVDDLGRKNLEKAGVESAIYTCEK
jgi:hypothetical protein